MVSLGLLILFSDFPIKQKVKDICLAGLIFLIPILSFHAFIYFKFGYMYFSRYSAVGVSAITETPKTFILLFKIMGWLFSFGWLASLYGAIEVWKVKDWKRIKILLALLPVTLTFYIWPSITQRLAVMFMMWLAILAGFGLSRIKCYILYLFLLLYITFNYNINILIKLINLPL